MGLVLYLYISLYVLCLLIYHGMRVQLLGIYGIYTHIYTFTHVIEEFTIWRVWPRLSQNVLIDDTVLPWYSG